METKELYALFLQHPEITTDSRDCPKGSIFFALKGENFDGNRFAATALQKGCSHAVVDNPEYASEGDNRYILVDNVLLALQQLAREHRRALGTTIIGITGTNGKTTTKELVATVLQQKYNTLYTQGNFNNDIGVPKTLLRLNANHNMAVVEMGASHPGDIKTLVEIVEPDYGIITNVGMAHLQGFGSFEGVKKTKGELYDYLREHNRKTIFLNADNKHLTEMAQGLLPVCYSTHCDNSHAVCGTITACDPYLQFIWKAPDAPEKHLVKTQLIGTYNIDNLLAAIAIGLHFNVPAEEISAALESYCPQNNRSQLTITEHNRLIVDAYNANPTSMKAALDNFAAMQVDHKMAILGDMKELGEHSMEEHCHIVEIIKSHQMKEVWLVGEEFAKTQSPYPCFANVEEVKKHLEEHPVEGKYILIKGSNSIRLSQLKDLL